MGHGPQPRDGVFSEAKPLFLAINLRLVTKIEAAKAGLA
jgi:hypothetical protein